ncbi:hypothetical protein [Stutzerimonas stutzeri]|uniref:hypothetical protein n=1 Tax=Stutzerimonas stutzeri TaxID=316 RepID=UPI001CFDA442|nr:hypothetical protein [Stutzerimonas stutzeri]|tara:strand:- start:854 stop:1072 length:219 start_codon:yes stop_codon:yes gene_type:complete
MLAAIDATSYRSVAIPTLIAGCLARHFSLLQAACGYGVLALLGCVAIFLLVRRAEAVRTPVSNFFSHAHFSH